MSNYEAFYLKNRYRDNFSTFSIVKKLNHWTANLDTMVYSFFHRQAFMVKAHGNTHGPTSGIKFVEESILKRKVVKDNQNCAHLLWGRSTPISS